MHQPCLGQGSGMEQIAQGGHVFGVHIPNRSGNPGRVFCMDKQPCRRLRVSRARYDHLQAGRVVCIGKCRTRGLAQKHAPFRQPRQRTAPAAKGVFMAFQCPSGIRRTGSRVGGQDEDRGGPLCRIGHTAKWAPSDPWPEPGALHQAAQPCFGLCVRGIVGDAVATTFVKEHDLRKPVSA